MRVELKTPPAEAAMTLADVKTYGDFKTTAQDAKITALITPSTEYIERVLGRKLINQSWYIYLDNEEYHNRLDAYRNSIHLYSFNVSSITEVNKYDLENSATVISSSDYRLSGNALSAVSKLVFNDTAIPVQESLRIVDSIRIEVVAGYGAAQSDIPDAIQVAHKMLIEYWVKYGMKVNKQNLYDTPTGFHAILQPYKSVEQMF
ncbi:MAG: hypothetical protein NE327_12390 [Lentisphaeraceae bacterium]|nr:hypothetical protein [Lentisphaeraceae bacterium]